VSVSSRPLVLIVDDYDDGRTSLAEFLEGSGFRPVTAANGEQGVTVARQLRPEAIVMDLLMPIMDGWEATRRLKALAETRDIPVIALTAYGHEDAHREAREAGCTEILVKPVDPNRLLERVRHLCRPGARGVLH